MKTQVTIHRVNPSRLELHGCLCKCGGSLAVHDYGRKTQFRYEVFCRDCSACDPNGWGTQAEVIAKSPEYFR